MMTSNQKNRNTLKNYAVSLFEFSSAKRTCLNAHAWDTILLALVMRGNNKRFDKKKKKKRLKKFESIRVTSTKKKGITCIST